MSDICQQVSTLLYNTVASYTLDIEAVSCDELYADITSILRQSGVTPSEFAMDLKEVIFGKTKCNASVGMGPNMLMARLATKKAKPNGLFYLNRKEMSEFMKDHKVEDLPGVGRSMAHRLHAIGVKTCLDMQQVLTISVNFGKFLFDLNFSQSSYRLQLGSFNKSSVKSKVKRSTICVEEKISVL